MAGLVPAIHALPRGTKNVDARDKPGHDDLVHLHMRLRCREGRTFDAATCVRFYGPWRRAFATSAAVTSGAALPQELRM